MTWAQLKDPVPHMCLTGRVVASRSLAQEVSGSSPINDRYSLSMNSVNLVKTFTKNSKVPVIDKWSDY